MFDLLSLVAISLVVASLFRWAFRTLPGEGWQILAAVPVTREDSHTWRGLNLTYYGLFIAGSTVAASSVFLILMGALGVPPAVSGAVAAVLFALCVPASSVLARIVEQRHNTLTIGGAAFLGIIIGPGVIWSINTIMGAAIVPVVPALAALSIAYAVGEGLGRLACISFGCCYGRPVADFHPRIRSLLVKYCFVFSGTTKKIAYEGGMEGAAVFPIQALTSVVLVCTAFVGIALYLRGIYHGAFLFCMLLTQTWRVLSELLRADYRGGGSLSVYQLMSIAAVAYTVALWAVLPSEQYLPASLTAGVKTLWSPGVILSQQLLGLIVFLHTGRSKVTASFISFHLQDGGTSSVAPASAAGTFMPPPGGKRSEEK